VSSGDATHLADAVHVADDVRLADDADYAGIVTRGIAIAIDAIVLTIGFAVTSALVGLILSLFTAVEVTSVAAVLGTVGAWTAVVAGYFTLFWTVAGQTPGMRMMHVQVLDARGDPPHLLRSAWRFVWMLVAAIPLFAGYLLILVDERRRGLHDVMASTTVHFH
jgi:uncharacterized RDD family membrane protein YckC